MKRRATDLELRSKKEEANKPGGGGRVARPCRSILLNNFTSKRNPLKGVQQEENDLIGFYSF